MCSMFKCQLNFNKVHNSPCKYEQGKIWIHTWKTQRERQIKGTPFPSPKFNLMTGLVQMDALNRLLSYDTSIFTLASLNLLHSNVLIIYFCLMFCDAIDSRVLLKSVWGYKLLEIKYKTVNNVPLNIYCM